MKVLHTSDWHLGKKLEGLKRIEEQEKFIDRLESIVLEENPKLILIAGDIFDTPIPSSEAEKLFFDAIKKLSNHGERGIVIIPGNHDSAERLVASKNLAKEFGVIIYENVLEEKEIGTYGKFQVEKTTKGTTCRQQVQTKKKRADKHCLSARMLSQLCQHLQVGELYNLVNRG